MSIPWNAASSDDLISYDEAAKLLKMKRASALQLAKRGHLHPIENPADRRRRLLSRREVEAYAAKRSLSPVPRPAHARRDMSPPIMPQPHTAGSTEASKIDPQIFVALGAALVALGLFVLAFKSASSVADRVLIIGALVALTLFVAGQQSEQGSMSEEQRRRLERLARAAEADPEPFVSELERILSQMQAA